MTFVCKFAPYSDIFVEIERVFVLFSEKRIVFRCFYVIEFSSKQCIAANIHLNMTFGDLFTINFYVIVNVSSFDPAIFQQMSSAIELLSQFSVSSLQVI